ncbi:MAG: enolase C-terminal domain-like protein [Pseudomonadota bacterium]
MKITRISVYQTDLPLAEPYWLSGGRLKFEALDATFVKLETDAGVTGWGEGTPWGHTYVPAHGPGIRAGIETMAPAILGQDPRRLEALERAMDACLPGHLYAKAPVDFAAWDISGQVQGMSLAAMLGGVEGDPGTRIVSSVSSGTPEEVYARIERFRAQGNRAHSVKVGGNAEADIARIRYLEERRLPEEQILYDVNRAWSRREAMLVMQATAGLGVTFEQPCESLDDIAAVRAVTSAPIAVDESLVTVQDAARVAREGIAEVVDIKLNRVGGLTRARRMRDIALAHGQQIYAMATGCTVMADAEAAALAQSVPESHRLGCWACQDMITVDVAPGRGPRNTGGLLRIGEAPGLGFAPDEDVLGPPLAVYSEG